MNDLHSGSVGARVIRFPVPLEASGHPRATGRLSSSDRNALRASCLSATLLLARELTHIQELLVDAFNDGRHAIDFRGPEGARLLELSSAVRGWLDTTEQIAVIADENPGDAWQQIREFAETGYGSGCTTLSC